jgi:hypothetical protein
LKKLDLEVLNISLEGPSFISESSILVNYRTLSICNDGSQIIKENMELANSPFIFSKYKNVFVAMGCDNFATMTFSDGSVTGCRSVCDTSTSKVIINNTRCNGINCCQTTIASHLNAFNTTIDPINTKKPIIDGCKYAFLAEENWFKTAHPFSNMSTYAPVVLAWGIPNTSVTNISLYIGNHKGGREYFCYTHSISGSNPTIQLLQVTARTNGFEGSLYLPRGCKG